MERHIVLVLTILPCTSCFSAEGSRTFTRVETCQVTTCPPGTMFHCLLDENWNLGQICMERRLIQRGMCAYYNTYQGNLDSRPCTDSSTSKGCPGTNFYSYDSSNYKNCMGKDNMKPSNRPHSSLDIHSNKTTTAKSGIPSDKNYHHEHDGDSITAAVVILLLVGVFIAACVILSCIKRKRNPQWNPLQLMRQLHPCREKGDGGLDQTSDYKENENEKNQVENTKLLIDGGRDKQNSAGNQSACTSSDGNTLIHKSRDNIQSDNTIDKVQIQMPNKTGESAYKWNGNKMRKDKTEDQHAHVNVESDTLKAVTRGKNNALNDISFGIGKTKQSLLGKETAEVDVKNLIGKFSCNKDNRE